jgi:hypothetical protein
VIDVAFYQVKTRFTRLLGSMAQDLQALAKANAARQCLADVVTRDGLNLCVCDEELGA